MLTFLVLLNGSPSTRATQEHLASLPSKDEANLTIIQIMRQERNYYRQLKVWKMRLTSCIPALDMLTLPVVLLSKPVGPIMRIVIPVKAGISLIFLSKNSLWAFALSLKLQSTGLSVVHGTYLYP